MNRRVFAVICILTFLLPTHSVSATEVAQPHTILRCNLKSKMNREIQQLQTKKCLQVQACSYYVPDNANLGFVPSSTSCIPVYCMAVTTEVNKKAPIAVLNSVQFSDCSPPGTKELIIVLCAMPQVSRRDACGACHRHPGAASRGTCENGRVNRWVKHWY